MGSKRFISRFPHRASRHVPAEPRAPGLKTRLDLRPARFVLGLGERVDWTRVPGLHAAPLCPAFYLGRVEEVVGDEVLTTVWERPSGREASTTLSVETHLRGESPLPGSLLRIWTWVELPGHGEQVTRLRVEVEVPHLSESERHEMQAVLETLKTDAASSGPHDP